MANGEIVHEIRSLLASGGKITSAVATRLTLAAVADLYDKVSALSDKVDAKVSDLSKKVDDIPAIDARIDTLEKRVNAWSYANSVGVLFAGILAWFK